MAIRFLCGGQLPSVFSQTDFSTIDRSDGRGKGGVGRRCDSADGDKTSIWKGRSCWLEGQERLRFTRRSARLPKDRAVLPIFLECLANNSFAPEDVSRPVMPVKKKR